MVTAEGFFRAQDSLEPENGFTWAQRGAYLSRMGIVRVARRPLSSPATSLQRPETVFLDCSHLLRVLR